MCNKFLSLYSDCLCLLRDFRKDLSRQLSRQQNQAAADPEEKKAPAAGAAHTVDDCARDKALIFKTFPSGWFTGDPDNACIGGGRNVTEGKNHSIPHESCSVTIRYAEFQGK